MDPAERPDAFRSSLDSMESHWSMFHHLIQRHHSKVFLVMSCKLSSFWEKHGDVTIITLPFMLEPAEDNVTYCNFHLIYLQTEYIEDVNVVGSSEEH